MSDTNKYIKFHLHDVDYETLPTKKYLQHKEWEAPNDKKLKAEIPGLVIDVMVKKNQKVKEGECVLLIEAMKMNNIISFVIDGTIKEIHVKKGEKVSKNQLLIELK
jgi:biotin carboxyl carrier protein